MKILLILAVLGTLVSCGKSLTPEELAIRKQEFLKEAPLATVGAFFPTRLHLEKVDTRDPKIIIIVTWFYGNASYSAINLEKYDGGPIDQASFLKMRESVYLQTSDDILARFPGEDIFSNDQTGQGGGVLYEDSNSNSKDLEKMGAKVEAMEVAEMEDTLISYGLSTDRASKLGKLLNSYSKIKTKRALTAREKDVFTKELTGMTFDKASNVLVDEGYDALIDRASEVNRADPEAIKELLNQVM